MALLNMRVFSPGCCSLPKPFVCVRVVGRNRPQGSITFQAGAVGFPSISRCHIAENVSRRTICVRSSESGKDDNTRNTQIQANQGNSFFSSNNIGSVAILSLWLGFAAYGFVFSVNQTPTMDMIYLQQALASPGSTEMNTVFFCLFNILGVYPLIFSLLLVPAGRSGNKVPAWPFAALSFAFGAFALLPYMALWQPQQPPPQLPPPKEDLEGWNRVVMKGGETVVLPGLLLAASLVLWGTALTAGPDSWDSYLKIIQQSRLAHVSTLDFCTLTVLLPFWMYNDASLRNWGPRDQLVPLLVLLPVVGPALYLVMRPKTQL